MFINIITMAEKKEFISNANSKGLIIDYYSTAAQTQGRKSDFNLNEALKVIKNDPVVKGAIISLVDRVLETPYQVVGKDMRSKIADVEKQLGELRFYLLLRKILFNLVLYGNSFIEIVKKKKKVTDLNLLESTSIEIVAENNGDIIEYVQRVGTDDKTNPIKWSPDKVTHYKLTEITTNVWAEVDIESLYETVLMKEYIRNWIAWFFKTNQARGFYNIKSAGDQKVKDFLSILKENENNPNKPVIAQGEVNYQLLRTFAEEGKSLNEVLVWADNQMLALLQVPPIIMGFPDMSGRSNSVEQFKAVNTRVKAIQNILSDYTTYDLFKKMGFDKAKLQFGSIDEQNMKQKLETIELMRNIGMTEEVITEWMRSQNMFFNSKKLFEEKEEVVMDKRTTEEKNPNRKKKGEGESNKQLDKISTRENQLVANSEDAPEFIEPTDQWKEFSE